jgi:hypothetical protein
MWTRLTGFAVSDDHWMAFRIADGRLNANFVQFLRQPLGSFLARGLEFRVGGNGLDFEEFKQAIETVVQVGINARQYLVDGTHDMSLNLETGCERPVRNRPLDGPKWPQDWARCNAFSLSACRRWGSP